LDFDMKNKNMVDGEVILRYIEIVKTTGTLLPTDVALEEITHKIREEIGFNEFPERQHRVR